MTRSIAASVEMDGDVVFHCNALGLVRAAAGGNHA